MDDKTFINRWSRTKLANAEPVAEPELIPEPAENAAPLPAVADDAGQSPDELTPPDLPSIESLDEGSDYTAFLGKNVPEELARKALRKLWSSDPVLANLDGLNDYDDDYSALGIVETVVETAYKVGKGLVTEDEAEIEEESEEEPTEEPVALQGDPAEESASPGDEEIVNRVDEPNQLVPHDEIS